MYLTANGLLERFYKLRGRSVAPLTVAVLGVAALAAAGVIPLRLRELVFPFYPLAFVPLFFFVAGKMPRPVARAVGFFAILSYEFYILHFYFIGRGFDSLFGSAIGLTGELAISFVVTLLLALLLSKVAARFRQGVDRYFLGAE